jgi:hypothetical protein
VDVVEASLFVELSGRIACTFCQAHSAPSGAELRWWQ